jgi:predicted dehydrogenase
MFTVGLIELGSDIDYLPLKADGWRLMRLSGKVKNRKKLESMLSDPQLNAVAILGHAAERFRFAERALNNRKHLILDFPAARTVEKARELNEKAARNNIWVYSPNLLTMEPSLKEVKRKIESRTGKLLSLTITFGVEAKRNSPEFLLRVARLLDMVKWLVGSKLGEVNCERSTVRSPVSAVVALASFDNDVKAMLNFYSVGENAHDAGLWVDCVFEDCIMHAEPQAQSIRMVSFRGGRVESVNWSTPALVEAIENFAARIDEPKQSLDLENIRRTLHAAEGIVGS